MELHINHDDLAEIVRCANVRITTLEAENARLNAIQSMLLTVVRWHADRYYAACNEKPRFKIGDDLLTAAEERDAKLLSALRDRESALVEALGGILYKSQTGEWYLDANTPSNIDAAGTTYANAKQSAADWREQVEEQATKPLREALESIRDWKSPDGVLQVKDLEWFKALATSDRASEKEGRDG